MNRIRIICGNAVFDAELFDTPTGRAIYEALPFEGRAGTWGDEVYFQIPLSLPEEPDARVKVEVGDLGYWPIGQAFCLFFGPTPVSTDGTPHAASAVNVFGRLLGDPSRLRAILHGATIRVEKGPDEFWDGRGPFGEEETEGELS